MWPTWLASLVASALLQHAACAELSQEQSATVPPTGNSSFYMTHLRRESCENARLRCAYRGGCGHALQNYLMGCSFLLDDSITLTYCPEPCQHALIALTSTEEGKNLMNCRCTDPSCEQQKKRVEVCRPQVEEAIREVSVVSCRVAEWICSADQLCNTALDYYYRNCKAMFNGRKCSPRCNNSLSILLRQEKAAKLASCHCDGHETYDCPKMRQNMQRLCEIKLPSPPLPPANVDTNEIMPGSAARTASARSAFGWTLFLLVVQLMARSLLAQDT